ncbi:low temperature requirement protein A [Streptomyces poriferorum]|uniref:Low temperature requirement protein A n=1 Tax=Streptomyces poriferorum TaxID=2798799 RepID=A0ABY9IQ46_9ACTN|nr:MULTISPECIES: low temperature requirement protein A [unclassified Streptomyces]MDP5313545.1 low temperature requirement protein A [Streptomyces sp. Alt4]WLQ57485.1 low temperature requirement protein A [Streptomyces sp. Alt2]
MSHSQPSPLSPASWHRPMVARLSDEQHRTATMLELFFDLCFVTAVAQAATAFEHELAEGHIGHGVLGYAMVFFAIWWAWMNFTWFASAYDTDDVPYRLLTLVQITGALVLAAGASQALQNEDFTVITWGYVIMRLAMVTQWLRAARSDPERRSTCLRYAVGIFVVQVGWVVRLTLPEDTGLLTFGILVLAEIAVPAWAERSAITTWHPHHIAERYGLFTLIVLGESITAATGAVHAALDSHTALGDLAALVVGGILTVFALWWLYFARSARVHDRLTTLRMALLWGYGHYLVFASAAAVGAGLAVNVAHTTGHGHLSDRAAAAVYTIPVAVFVTLVWLLHHRTGGLRRAADVLHPVAVLAVLAATFAPSPVLVTGVITALLIATTLVLSARSDARRDANGGTGADTGKGTPSAAPDAPHTPPSS